GAHHRTPCGKRPAHRCSKRRAVHRNRHQPAPGDARPRVHHRDRHLVKIGILGGTFDPVHYGHLVAGEEARCSLGLERVLFVPSARPPHKLEYPVSPTELRVEMVRRAIADNPNFELSTVELDRAGYSYTVDTMAELQEQLGPK